MDNILSTLDERVVPAAIAAGTPSALKTGHLTYGEDLFKAFVSDTDAELSQVKLIQRLATEIRLDCIEFEANCKQALELAAQADAMSGFKAREGAKGKETQGPKRRVLTVRLSEARALFGTFKRKPEILKEKGYWTAIATARDYLKGEHIKWDGIPVESKEVKAQKAETKARREAIQEVMSAEPMLDDIAAIRERAQQKVFETEVEDLMKRFEKAHGHGDVALTACARILECYSDAEMLDDLVQSFGEAAQVLRMADEQE